MPHSADINRAYAALLAALDAAPEGVRAALTLRTAARLVEASAYASARTGDGGDAPRLILMADWLERRASCHADGRDLPDPAVP